MDQKFWKQYLADYREKYHKDSGRRENLKPGTVITNF